MEVHPYTIVTTKQNLLEDTFPLYTVYLGLGMYATHYFITFVYLGSLEPSLFFDRIIWIGTYITPYIFHFWLVGALFILGILFFRDYRRGFRQIKLESNQITLYPKQQTKELQVLSWEKPITTILLSKKNTSFDIDLENQCLILPYVFYSSEIFKIVQFYAAQLINEPLSNKIEFQDED